MLVLGGAIELFQNSQAQEMCNNSIYYINYVEGNNAIGIQ